MAITSLTCVLCASALNDHNRDKKITKISSRYYFMENSSLLASLVVIKEFLQ